MIEIKDLEILREVSNLPQVQAEIGCLENSEGAGVSALHLQADGRWYIEIYIPVAENPDRQVGIHAYYYMHENSDSDVELVYSSSEQVFK